jgi:hypothetical protein
MRQLQFRMRRMPSTFVPVLCMLVAACTGVIHSREGQPRVRDDGGAAGGFRPADEPGSDVQSCTATPAPGASPLRRLTVSEYNNTVRDLLGDTTAPANGFPRDTTAGVFSNRATSLTVAPLLATGYQQAAESLAAKAIVSPGKLITCDPKTGDDACAKTFINSFARRAFRRPVTTDEETTLFELFSNFRTDGSFLEGIGAVIEATLQSASFLYRPELGLPGSASGGAVALAPYEMASRLSYLIWGSMPDEPLFEAAEAGRLAKPEDIATEARRLLADPRAKTATLEFFGQWLNLRGLAGVNKDPTLYPGFDDATRSSMLDESRAFVDWVMWQSDGRVQTLLTTPKSFLDANTAKIYGANAVAGGTPTLTDLDPAQRAGILTHPSLLAILAKPNQSSPILRGKFVRERFLCQELPPPPANLIIVPPEVAKGTSTRERFSQHAKDAACTGCHSLMDPIGFGFEHYDAIGRFRTTDDGRPVDSNGTLMQSDADGAFDGVPDLARRLAQSGQVNECVATQWFQYSMGRGDHKTNDKCSIDTLQSLFRKANFDMRELAIAITQTDAFRFRTEVTP